MNRVEHILDVMLDNEIVMFNSKAYTIENINKKGKILLKEVCENLEDSAAVSTSIFKVTTIDDAITELTCKETSKERKEEIVKVFGVKPKTNNIQ